MHAWCRIAVPALVLCLFAFPTRAVANASVFVNNNVASCVYGFCGAASVFGVLVGPSDTLQFKGGTFTNDIGLSSNATLTATGTNNFGDSTHADVVDFSASFTASAAPCTGSGCTAPPGSSFSSTSKVWGGTKPNSTLVSNAYSQFLDLAAYWNSQSASALPSQALNGNWNIQSSGSGVHVYNASSGYAPTNNVTIGCGAAGNNTAVGSSCSSTDLIVILVPNGQTANLLHNISFAAASGLTDDQLLFVINGTASNALSINAGGGGTVTVHGDFFVDKGGGYTIGGTAGGNHTNVDGRVFAGGGTAFPTLVWNQQSTLSDEAAVPEPGTWALMIGGLGGLFWWQRRRKSNI